jgi:MFS family permease
MQRQQQPAVRPPQQHPLVGDENAAESDDESDAATSAAWDSDDAEGLLPSGRRPGFVPAFGLPVGCGPCGASARGAIGLLIFGVWTVCYADRAIISLAVVKMEDEFGWSSSVDGLVLSAFFGGYTCTQILGGVLAARFGGKPVLAVAVLAWSVLTLATPLAARAGLWVLVACRVLLGFGEGVTLPAIHQVTAQWVPQRERSRFVGMTASGQYVGTALTLVSSPLVDRWWPSVFLIFGAVGLAWLSLWLQYGGSSPAQQRPGSISEEERRYIEHDLQRVEESAVAAVEGRARQSIACEQESARHSRARALPWRRFLTEPACIAIYVVHFSHNWAGFFALSWLPKYLVDVVGVPLGTSGFYLLLPALMPFLGCNAGGALAHWLQNARGWPVLRVRKCLELISSSAGIVCVGYFVLEPQPTAGAFVLATCVSNFLGSFCLCSYFANILDIAGPGCVSAILGISNSIAAVPGVLANVLAGFWLEASGQWQQLFAVSVGMQAVGLAVYLRWASGERLFH